jgi:hypothetical protein
VADQGIANQADSADEHTMLEVERMHSAVSRIGGALVRLFRMGDARWCAYCGGYARHDAWEAHHAVVDQPITYATRIERTAINPVGSVRSLRQMHL